MVGIGSCRRKAVKSGVAKVRLSTSNGDSASPYAHMPICPVLAFRAGPQIFLVGAT